MRFDFNSDWRFYTEGNLESGRSITLPHDAMLGEKRSAESAGGVNSAWFTGGDYIYEKTFAADERCVGQKMILEFEGVYRNAEIFVNGKRAGGRPYGFTGFYADITDFVSFDKENLIRVTARNSDQPNCRWYSGAGIYRPVSLHLLPKRHIMLDGIKIKTIDYTARTVGIEVRTNANGVVKIEILDGEKVICTAEKESDGSASFELELENARLWDAKHPNLYECKVTFYDDRQKVRFGIRDIAVSAEKGFCINGERVILKGACVHSDNGILGAAAHGFAEKRKVRLLKENGYNAVRAAHNPASKAFLDACDELGMLVLDEYTDGWYMHKTRYDYASNIEDWWRQDLSDMVDKDYNHPSVVMYSIGNEVGETASKKGVEFGKEMVKYLKARDYRPVTCGINIFFNYLSSLGLGVYSDKKADKNKNVGSAFFNNLAGLLGDEFMKFGATLHGSDVRTREIFGVLDAAGYNYGIRRYKKDLKKYPDRIILGSETFCKDAALFWDAAKAHPAIIGDFVWAGIDYLGEVGIGAWEYKDYAKTFRHLPGWISAGSGRIDLTGSALAEMKYTRVAFEQDGIGIGVVPVDNTRSPHSPSAWKMSNAIESWSWDGCEGKCAKIEVYSRAHKVKLYVNDKLIGVKKPNKNAVARFTTKYVPGKLTAVGIDIQGNTVVAATLCSASHETVLTLLPEDGTVGCNDLSFVRLKYTDAAGNLKPTARGKIKVTVSGGELLALGHACPYNEDGYLGDTTDTYYGQALAVIRPSGKGKITIAAQSEKGAAETTVEVV